MVLVVKVYTLLLLFSPSPRPSSPSESIYTHPLTSQPESFACVFHPPTLDLTVIFPAYNEVKRLPKTLEETIEYLVSREQKNKKERKGEFKWEVIVVDDGSKDETANVAMDVARKLKEGRIKVLKLVKNRGKGGAVTQGVLRSSGKFILFADSDGATLFSDIEKLESEMNKNPKELGVVIGSRSHLVKTEAVVKRSMIRNFLMYSFHSILYVLGIRSIRDTQCGFKLFTRSAAQIIFSNIHVEGWIFDIEVLLIAEMTGIPVKEVTVNWVEVEGSKMSLVRDSIKMLRDLLIIRGCYLLGVWKVKNVGTAVGEDEKNEVAKNEGKETRKSRRKEN
ncbi:nucleotide-diphospho-sugar transferase [Paraphysoderma sedebokerense]|nr:nucleotide-diphospho-sugar transferase [Paraphysoderma sedebokerense]